jgi:Outer membrane protein beta-barrel domain
MKHIVFLLLCLSFSKMQAQYWEVGPTGGATSSISDLQPNAPTNGSFGKTYGALVRLNYNPLLSFKVTGLSGGFYATDKYAKGTRRFRNLEAQTQYYELAATAELNLTRFDVMDGKTSAPYLFAGIAGFYFNPRARLNGAKTWTNLQPLGTEGQTLEGGKKPYSQLQIAVPMGVGFKIAIAKRANLGFEAGLRYTFTDYLDDISGIYPDLKALAVKDPNAAALSFRSKEILGNQLELPSGQKRGDSYKNDLYYYIGATFTVNLGSAAKMEYNKEYRSFLQK